MKPLGRELSLFGVALFGVWISLVGHVTPASILDVTPVAPAIFVGQTQQFTANGVFAPTGVSAGGEYTCVRLPDGTGQCTGRNQFGQLGNGTFYINASTLVEVSGLAAATRIAAGDEFGCALLQDGTARCWGLGEYGQRGDGSFERISTVPVEVIGITNAVDIKSGYSHACVLLEDGTIRCWGANRYGQLGDPSTQAGSAVPVVVTGISDAAALTTGADHACALLGDGNLQCWGKNDTGQLGDGTFTSSSTPVPVQGLTDVVAISGGGMHMCAVSRNGTVKCWGENERGQLGDGTNFTTATPVQVVGISGAVAVSSGWRHTCALLNDGTVRCWGDNEFGQLGDGTTTTSSIGVQVVGITGAVAITAGWWHHSCALLADGSVRCWGANEWGQLGNGTNTASSVPVAMTGTGVTWTSSDTAVATINVAGRATGVGRGATTITATDGSGASASTTLTVRELVTLSVVRSGAGTGTITSNPPGISCGTDCSEAYDSSSSVTLTATPDGSSTFFGWVGCESVSGSTCTVTMGTARTVTAVFDLRRFVLTASKAGLGGSLGSVQSSPSGISCGTDCYEPYTIGTVVTLTASPEALLTAWSGCDSVSQNACTVTVKSDRAVTATFVGAPF
jgi:alpha-tubulin suppressor-like RCC1 family protein